MIEAKYLRRHQRRLRSTCLAAGLLALGLGFVADQAAAQSLNLPKDNTTTIGDAASEAGVNETPDTAALAKIKNRKKRGAAAADDAELLNPRSAKLLTSQGSEEAAPELDLGRDNLKTGAVDGLRPSLPPENTDTPGIRFGTFVLRPSVNTSVNSETTKSSSGKSDRAFLQNELKGTLTSDWSLHQLTVTGQGIVQKNISGSGQTEPSANINADLRLDLSDETVAHLTAGYSLTRESATDPNAVAGATDQSAVQGLSAGGSIERDFGLLRGLAALDISRTSYSDVTLSDGSTYSLRERDRNGISGRVRVGYDLSPALIPFLEASAGRTVYDLDRDAAGYDRDTKSLGGKVGVALDFGEKLKGELGLGYRHVTFADARLAAIDAAVLDAAATWSPRRGTDITFGLTTSVEPSVVAGQSGYVNRALTVALAQQVRDNIVAKLTGGATWRDYRPEGLASNEVITTLGTGMSYGLNRYVDLTADLSWERTTPDGGDPSDVLRAGIGLTLKR